MNAESADSREMNRILSTALEDPETVPDRDIQRALGLLESDDKRVRVGAAWLFGVLASESSERALSYLPEIAARIDDDDRQSEAARALGYVVAHADSAAIERALRAMDDTTARRCREALWGQLAERRVIETPGAEDEDDGTAMGRTGGDRWGWTGGGSATTAYDAETESDRRRPPTERPVDPPSVDYGHDHFTPVEVLSRTDTAASFEVVYRTPDGGTAPGILKRFDPPNEGVGSAFDRRLRMWRSIDDHEAVLPVVDWGVEPGPWFVTAYGDVTGLADLERDGRLEAAVWTLDTIAETLRLAHAHGVIHGALTPGSIVRSSILTEPDAWRFPRVTDWGYVNLFRNGTAPGIAPKRYLAPEHVDPDSAAAIDGPTDVYGFGVLVHEAFAGHAPTDPAADGSGAGIALPEAVDRRVPELESFLRRCLAERKAERFETVAAMENAFRSAVGGPDG